MPRPTPTPARMTWLLTGLACVMMLTACMGPLHQAALDGNTKQVRALLDQGMNVNEPDFKGYTPLHFAAQSGVVDTANVLLERGAEVNTRGGTVYTPLHLAAGYGHLNMVSFLLERGATPTMKVGLSHGHWTGKTAAQIAEREGYPAVAQILKEAEARTQGTPPAAMSPGAPAATPARPAEPPPPIY